ncbi:FMN-binding negative transcriptional regulator [Marinomonas colpomeniae]|uniref:FMN-binding negative transcriptional regulator n=1 Tax=Marinomonas colpomeniae TaxID=2774408 RepID=A0ABR8NWC6_9GAMM|nr:FMN-binding negative transcriptional regulator [Marinomonas colpomeniae]MBD5770354.1 FMN-binding negative transcriptional regulator [Marinomonas colpomeniae]
MYIPNNIKMDDLFVAHDFIEEFGFGLIVSSSLTGTHIPFVLHKNEGEKGTLYSHCAKANPHWKELDKAEVLIVFTGPHSYISPSWYAKSPGVPTWNYSAVHAYGVVSLLNDNETLEAVEEVVHKYEPALLAKRDIITDEFRDKLLSGVVGFKIELSRIEGKLKLGQQRAKEDQVGVFNALSNSKNLDDLALANYMEKLNVGIGS